MKYRGFVRAVLALAAIQSAPQALAVEAAWLSKLEPQLAQESQAQERVQFMIYLDEQADLSAAARQPTRVEKGRVVVQALKAVAARTQPPVLEILRARGVEHRAFWLANAIHATGTRADIEAVARHEAARSLHLIKTPVLPAPTRPQKAAAKLGEGPEPGVVLIRAPEVWALGFTGQGVVVGDHDVGVEWDHPALKRQYRGWNGETASHDYNWLNAFPVDPFCDDLLVPCDPNGHGTHTTGTMVGDDGAGAQIGVAPDAQWIACRSLLDPIVGLGFVPTYMACMEWTIAPYPGDNPDAADPAMAPDVVNNSWGCLEACAPPVLQSANEAVKAAGIVQVVSAGNDGSECSTLAFPIAVYESSFTVGASNFEDQMASFSSRGPVLSDLSMRVKPNVVAPGVGVVSSTPGADYGSLSGTSMAGPHVAGLVALVLSAEPKLIGRVDEVRTLIEQTAVPIETTEVCGGTGQDDIPNNIFGYGRVDALAAVQARAQLAMAASAPSAAKAGQPYSYEMTVAQPADSRMPATGVRVTTELPAGTELVSASEAFSAEAQQVLHPRLTRTGRKLDADAEPARRAGRRADGAGARRGGSGERGHGT